MSQRRLSRPTLGFRINFESLEDRSMLSAHSLLASGLHEASSHDKVVNTTPAVIGTAVAGASQKASHGTESHLSAQLVDPGSSATGKVQYETETEHGKVKNEFSVSVKGAAPSTSLDVTIDGVIVGQITTDSSGRGKLKFSSQPHGSEQAFPANFPTINAGSVVSVGTITGTLATGTGKSSH